MVSRLRPGGYDPGGEFLHHSEGVARISAADADLMLTLATDGKEKPIRMVDPFVGDGTLPIIAQLFYHDLVEHIEGSDIDKGHIQKTMMNFGLVTNKDRIRSRLAQMQHYQREGERPIDYSGIQRLLDHVEGTTIIPHDFKVRDAFDAPRKEPDLSSIVVTDPPYGEHCAWKIKDGSRQSKNLLRQYLDHAARHYNRMVFGTGINGASEKAIESWIGNSWKIAEKYKRDHRLIYSVEKK